MARIEAEAANPVVDVLVSASWDTATDFAKRGWLLNYTSPNAAKVPDFLKSEGAVAQGISALGHRLEHQEAARRSRPNGPT